jgi:YebC/PmpR family DNA-binding regulatory protein
MSGHSKWHNIRVKKTAEDAKRGKVYTRHAKLIEMAARSGGNPDMNPGLRTAIDNAKADNVPNANIDRAIQKGTGELKGAAAIEEVAYAAYGPGGVACLIECLTDNKNRTLSNLKLAIGKSGGTWAESGAVAWMFERKGVVTATKTGLSPAALEELELELIDFGAENLELDGAILTVTTDLSSWTGIRDFLKKQGFEIVQSGLRLLPTQKQAITDSAVAKKLLDFVEAIEADDDVSEVFTNAEFSEGVIQGLEA